MRSCSSASICQIKTRKSNCGPIILRRGRSRSWLTTGASHVGCREIIFARRLSMTNFPTRPNALPRNFPVIPGGYSDALFRLQIDTARRYLFETELKEILEQAQIPLQILEPEGGEVALDVYQIACFM